MGGVGSRLVLFSGVYHGMCEAAAGVVTPYRGAGKDPRHQRTIGRRAHGQAGRAAVRLCVWRAAGAERARLGRGWRGGDEIRRQASRRQSSSCQARARAGVSHRLRVGLVSHSAIHACSEGLVRYVGR